ncbi:MAG: hypothetical protein P1P62_04855, partial [Treponema pedis]
NPQNLKIFPVVYFMRWAYFRQCRWHCLKTPASLPFGKRRVLYAVSHFVAKRRKINNPQNLKIFPVVYFMRWAYFRQCRWHCLKTPASLPFGKRRVLYAVSHFVAKRRKINNPRNLKILAVAEFIGRFFGK